VTRVPADARVRRRSLPGVRGPRAYWEGGRPAGSRYRGWWAGLDERQGWGGGGGLASKWVVVATCGERIASFPILPVLSRNRRDLNIYGFAESSQYPCKLSIEHLSFLHLTSIWLISQREDLSF